MLITIIAFLFVLGLLVLVHELGHFIVAKKIGVKVEEFAFGFPPRLFSIKRGETRYSVNLIPFGGYVKMLGELEHSTSPRAFENQTPGKRFVISIAGVVMNLLLAWLILAIGFTVGMSPLVSNPNELPGKKVSSEIFIADINKDSAAAKAGLKQGDVLERAIVEGKTVNFNTADDVADLTSKNQGKTVTIIYREDGQTFSKEITLSNDAAAPLGIAVVEKAIVKVPWYKAPYVALYETYQVTRLTLGFFGGFLLTIFTHGRLPEGVSGPVGIYVYSGLALQAGLMVFFQFIAMLSINLALINILPFPALDGGRLLFIILEKVKGQKAVREEIENLIHTIGFVILIILILVITYKDIVKLF